MESMTACRQRLEALRCLLAEQMDALAALKEVFALEAAHIHRHDQAGHLRDLRSKVIEEVEYVRQMESSAHYAFNKATLIRGLVKFGLGALVAALARSPEHPLSVGARLAKDDFERAEPYGTVLLVVESGGLLDKVTVVSLSRLARESGRPEAEIEAALKARGYLLVTPQDFSEVVDDLEDRVLRGILDLPVARASLLMKSADGGLEDPRVLVAGPVVVWRKTEKGREGVPRAL